MTWEPAESYETIRLRMMLRAIFSFLEKARLLHKLKDNELVEWWICEKARLEKERQESRIL